MSRNPALDRPWPTLNLSSSFVSTWFGCKRAAFWKVWWSWGAWKNGPTSTSESRRLAYAIKKGITVWSLAGSVVHRHAARHSRIAGHGRDLPAVDEVVAAAVGEYRDQVGKARRRSWKRASKKAPILLESFYGMDDAELDELVEAGASRVEACVRNLAADEHLDALTSEAKDGNRPLVHVEEPCRVHLVAELVDGGPRPALVVEGLEVPLELWVVPDLAYTIEVPGGDGRRELVIVDWKTGAPRTEHRQQLAIYATWAASIGWPAESVLLVASYLEGGEVREHRFDQAEERGALLALVEVLGGVREAVEEGDLAAMVPRMDATGSAFPQLEEGDPECARCDWRKLCRRD